MKAIEIVLYVFAWAIACTISMVILAITYVVTKSIREH